MADKAFDEEQRRDPIKRGTSRKQITIADQQIPPSRQADPQLRVSNAERSPQPFVDLTQTPSLTGTWFDTKGRYRLFINHVGKHVEGLLTLVSTHINYNDLKAGRDARIPTDWGLPEKETHLKPLAFRFAGDASEAGYLLTVPKWIGAWDPYRPSKYSGLPNELVGTLGVVGRDQVSLVFDLPFWSRWPEVDGFGQFDPDGRVHTVARRHDEQPVLLDRYLGRSRVPFHVRTAYWFPLTPIQAEKVPAFADRIRTQTVPVDPKTFRLRRGGTRMDLYDLLIAERELGMEYQDALTRNELMKAVNEIVWRVFERPALESPLNGGFGVAHFSYLKFQILRILDAWQLEPADAQRHSVGTALMRALDRVDEGRSDVSKIKRYLGLGGRGWRTFRYEIEIRLFKLLSFEDKKTQEAYEKAKKWSDRLKKEIEKYAENADEGLRRLKKITKYLPLTYMAGWATVKFTGVVEDEDPTGEPRDDKKEEAPWTAEFGFVLSGLKMSKSAGDSLTIKKGVAEVRAATPPTKEDLEGMIAYGQGDLFGGIDVSKGEGKGSWGGKVGGSKAAMSFYGSSKAPSVAFILDGALGENKEGAAAGFKVLYGDAWLLDGTHKDIILAEDERGNAFDEYWIDRVSQVAVHFPINGARLPVPTASEEDIMYETGHLSVRGALETFAACELPLLAHPLAGIKIDGYADPPDDPVRNQTLSENRAKSVRNFLFGILGDSLTWGMSDVELETIHRVVVEGHGEPGAPSRREKSGIKEEYDAELRRVDVSVALRKGPKSRVTADDDQVSIVRLSPPPKGK